MLEKDHDFSKFSVYKRFKKQIVCYVEEEPIRHDLKYVENINLLFNFVMSLLG